MPRLTFSVFPILAALAGVAAAADPQVITVKTLPAQMRYDVNDFTVKPGAEVKLVFENADDMPHNMVFFQPGTDVVAVCMKQMEKPDEALKRNWLPDDPKIWLHSKVLNPKEKEELSFKAPEKPGIYPFVCSMPGHAMTMQGKLRVAAPGPQLTSLHFKMYLGDWKSLPDFGALKPHREGEIGDNLIQLKLDDYKNQFGVVYTGTLNAPTAGEYTFAIAGDDGVRLLVDGKKVVDHDGIHPSTDIKEGKVKLEAGDHECRVEYFQAAGEAEVFVAWRGPTFTMTPLSKWTPPSWKEGAPPKKKDDNVGMPLVVEKEPVIYRNFIQGAGNRGIGVGYPGHMNIAWSAETLNVEEVWRGAFIDAARHWHDRGGGAQPPLGYDVVKLANETALPLAVLSKPDAEWPQVAKGERAEGYQFKGYKLDQKRVPTFEYSWNGVTVTDRFDVEGDAVAGEAKLVRTLSFAGSIPAGAYLRLATGAAADAQPNTFTVDAGAKLQIVAEGAQVAGKNLVVPVKPQIKVSYAWPGGHMHHNHN